MDKKIKYWIELAEYDIQTAKAMLETKRFLYVGFMCQQTIEKSLKAIIAKNNEFPPKTHNIIRLIEISKIEIPEDYMELIYKLQPLNIEARYPAYKEQLLSQMTSKICEDLITKTEVLFKWIKTKL